MMFVNRIVKLLGYFLIYLATFINCYLLSFLVVGTCMSLVMTILGTFSFVPVMLANMFWFYHYVFALILSLIIFIVMVVKVNVKIKL